MPSRKARSRTSPCCGADSVVRAVSLEDGEMALRCCECKQLRIEPISQAEAELGARRGRLRLIVNNT